MSVTLENSAAIVSAGRNERLFFVDVLRVSIVIFVIVHHAAQAYRPTGGVWPVHDRAQSNWFLPFYTVNAAFGLGMLFFLAGYFVPGSYERKGPRRFLMGRWVRLGVPLVSFALLIHLPMAYFLASHPALVGQYPRGDSAGYRRSQRTARYISVRGVNREQNSIDLWL
jgi:glucans biosynthesis protein C